MKNINTENTNSNKIILTNSQDKSQKKENILTKDMTCITCPIGCSLCVKYTADKELLGVTGATCKRGETYAYNEITNPKRVITSTVIVKDTGSVTSVKTDVPVPKNKIMECIKYINHAEIDKNAKIGDIVIPNILDTGANIILTRDAS